jgi:hypothetical protein
MADKSYYVQVKNIKSSMFIESGEIMGDEIIVKPIMASTRPNNNRIIGYTINPDTPIDGSVLNKPMNEKGEVNEILKNAILVAAYLPQSDIDEINTREGIRIARPYVNAEQYTINWNALKIRSADKSHVTMTRNTSARMIGDRYKNIFNETASKLLPTNITGTVDNPLSELRRGSVAYTSPKSRQSPIGSHRSRRVSRSSPRSPIGSPRSRSVSRLSQRSPVNTSPKYSMWSGDGGKRKSKKARSIKKKTRKAKRRNSHKKK